MKNFLDEIRVYSMVVELDPTKSNDLNKIWTWFKRNHLTDVQDASQFILSVPSLDSVFQTEEYSSHFNFQKIQNSNLWKFMVVLIGCLFRVSNYPLKISESEPFGEQKWVTVEGILTTFARRAGVTNYYIKDADFLQRSENYSRRFFEDRPLTREASFHVVDLVLDYISRHASSDGGIFYEDCWTERRKRGKVEKSKTYSSCSDFALHWLMTYAMFHLSFHDLVAVVNRISRRVETDINRNAQGYCSSKRVLLDNAVTWMLCAFNIRESNRLNDRYDLDDATMALLRFATACARGNSEYVDAKTDGDWVYSTFAATLTARAEELSDSTRHYLKEEYFPLRSRYHRRGTFLDRMNIVASLHAPGDRKEILLKMIRENANSNTKDAIVDGVKKYLGESDLEGSLAFLNEITKDYTVDDLAGQMYRNLVTGTVISSAIKTITEKFAK